MAAGYDLKEGKYDQSLKSVREIKNAFSKFFEKSSKKESTYKYAMLKSIIDCMNTASDKTYKVTFDSLFCRFSEIYWVLVFKHKIPQKAPSVNTPETYAERIVNDIALKYKIKRKTPFTELSNTVRYELMSQMKKKCSKYVFGALYAETDYIFYSFSKNKQWIKLNPQVVDYINKHLSTFQIQNYQAWAKFYTEAIALDNDMSHYQRLLKREFGDNSVVLCADPSFAIKRLTVKKKESTKALAVYDVNVAKKVRVVLQQHPDIGLYVAQISEKICEDKEKVREILDNSFWSRKEGSRYFYKDITDEDIISDALFRVEEEDFFIEEDNSNEPDEELIKLLEDPEQLIKKLKSGEESQSTDKHRLKKRTKEKAQKEAVISTKSMQRNWEREEVVILVVEYFNSKNLPAEKIYDSQQKISEFLRKREEILTGHPVDNTFRNMAGIRMQSGRIKCLDPETKYSGMQGTKLQKAIVEEYLANPKKMIAEAKKIYKKYM